MLEISVRRLMQRGIGFFAGSRLIGRVPARRSDRLFLQTEGNEAC